MKRLLFAALVAALALTACNNNEPSEQPGNEQPGTGDVDPTANYAETILGSWQPESCILTSMTMQNTTDLTETSYHGKHIESFNYRGAHAVFEDGFLINHTNYKISKDTMVFFDDYNTFADTYIIDTLTNQRLVYRLKGEGYFITYTFHRHADYSEELIGTWTLNRTEPVLDADQLEFPLNDDIEFKDNGVMYVLSEGDEAERFFFVCGDDLNLESKIFHITRCDEHNLEMERTVEGNTTKYFFSR